MSTIQERMIEARTEAGLTQAQLAARAGCGQTTIASIENGRNKGATPLVMIANVLQVSPLWLVDGIGPKRHRGPVQLASGRPAAVSVAQGSDIAALSALVLRLGRVDRLRVVAYAQALVDCERPGHYRKRCPVIPIRPTPCRTVPPSEGVQSDEMRPIF